MIRYLLIILIILASIAAFANTEMIDLIRADLKDDLNQANSRLKDWQPDSNLGNFYRCLALSYIRTHRKYSTNVIIEAKNYAERAEKFLEDDFRSARDSLKLFVDNLTPHQKDSIRFYPHSRWQIPAFQFVDISVDDLNDLNNVSFFVVYNILENLNIIPPAEISAAYDLLYNRYTPLVYEFVSLYSRRFDNFKGWDKYLNEIATIISALANQVMMIDNTGCAKEMFWIMNSAEQNLPGIVIDLFSATHAKLEVYVYLREEIQITGVK
jgi:hypothetical protein